MGGFMTMRQINTICLGLFLLNGCGGSKFLLGEENDRTTGEVETVPYLFSRPADLLGGGYFVPPGRHTYREVLVEKVGGGRVRNHTNFQEGRRKVTVNAIELVWEEGKEGGWGDTIDGQRDIHTLTLNAKIVKILSPLRVPGADVVINAKILEVGPGGYLDITPGFRQNRPEKSGESGRSGERAGRIVLNVEELNNGATEGPILIARGGRGQSGSLGRDGKDGISVPTIGKEGMIYRETVDCFLRSDDVHGSYKKQRKNQLVRIQDFRCSIMKTEGRMNWPESGEDALGGGRPGDSGDGGVIITDIPLKNSEVNLSPGSPGTPTLGYKGGAAGTPQTAYALVRDHSTPNGSGVRDLVRHTQAGKDAPPLYADVLVGKAGRVLPLGEVEGSWSTPGYRKMLQWYAEDNYLAYSFDRAEEIYQESLKFFRDEDAESRLSVLNARFQLQKLYSHQDIFFRPAGGIPGFYFYRNNSVVEGEIKWAMELLYRVRGAKKGYKREREMLADWALEAKEKGRKDFYSILEMGRNLWGAACKEKDFLDLFKPVSSQMLSDLYDWDEEGETLLLKNFLQVAENLIIPDNGNLSLWSQGRKPHQSVKEEKEPCEKTDLELRKWIGGNNVRQGVFTEFAMKAARMYLSLQKKIFREQVPSEGELEGIEREVKKVLLKHYTDAVKSYQYYHLASWQGFFPWSSILSKADEVLERSENDWRDLKEFYWRELEKIFRPKTSSFLTDTLSIRLKGQELEELRHRGRLYLNLLDGKKTYRGRKGVKVQTIELQVEAQEAGEYELSVTHPGRFYIQKDEKTYYVEMPTPKVWKIGGHFRGGGVNRKRGADMSLVPGGDFMNVFEHDSPLAPLPGGLTQLMVESGKGGELISGVELHISYRYHP